MHVGWMRVDLGSRAPVPPPPLTDPKKYDAADCNMYVKQTHIFF